MSKTTNFEISKKLAEIGFDKETNFYFTEIAPDKFKAEYYTNNKKYFLLKSYNLETLLDALPKSLKSKLELRIWFDENNAYIGYQNFEGFDKALNLEQQENESLADTAGRLIILLESKNLIKF